MSKKPKSSGFNRKILFTILFTVIVGSLALVSLLSGSMVFFEQKLLDFRFQIANPGLKPSQDVVFVDINDESLAALSKDYGSWPWPRGDVISSAVVDYVMQGNPAAFMFDILYPEYSPKHPGEALPEQDKIMVMDAVTWPNVSHAVQFQTADALASTLPTNSDASFAIPIKILPGAVKLPEGFNPVTPFSELADNAASLHLVNESQDQDGTSRRYSLIMEQKGKFYPSLALKSLGFRNTYTSYSLKNRELQVQVQDG